MPDADPAAAPPLLSEPVSELHYRRSLRRSLERRAAAARARARRRRGRTGLIALLGAMTLAAGGAAAQDQVGGANADAPASSSSSTRRADVVRQVQAKLGIRADGKFGPRSRRALKRWERRNGLLPDGRIDSKVLAAMGIDASASRAPSRGVPAILERIAQCESGGDPTAVSSDGRYRGKYQFSRATWRAVGGTGDPAEAPEGEQDRLAAKLYAAEGTKPWPVCGRQA